MRLPQAMHGHGLLCHLCYCSAARLVNSACLAAWVSIQLLTAIAFATAEQEAFLRPSECREALSKNESLGIGSIAQTDAHITLHQLAKEDATA